MTTGLRLALLLGVGMALGCGEDAAAPPGKTISYDDNAFTDKPWQLTETCEPGAPRDPGPSPLARVSNFEFDNMYRDLQANIGLTPAFPNASEDVAPAPGPVTNLHVPGYVSAAKAFADTVVIPNFAAFAGCATQDTACATEFIKRFGQQAFRRPLSDAEVSRFSALVNLGVTKKTLAVGVSMAAQAILNSADFLYRPEVGKPAGDGSSKLTGLEVASRLSFLLWGSIPDAELLQKASSGGLDEPTGIAAEAERMLAVRAKSEPAIAEFFSDWLVLRGIGVTTKDATEYPTFTPELALAMQTEAELFVNQSFWQGLGVSDLFLSTQSFMNKPLADFYGITGPTGAEFAVVPLDGVERFGMLSQGGFLAREAKNADTNPVKRGKFVQMNLLCGVVQPPPPGVEAMFPEISEDATQRERFELHRADPACQGCHQFMDPIGLAIEHYDGVGLYRDQDSSGRELDVSGELIGTKDVDGPYVGLHELSQKLAQSFDTRACVSKRWFEHTLSRGLLESDACNLKGLLDEFQAQNFRLNSLAVAMVKLDAFRYIRTVQGGSQ